ncbi:DNA cytosine methyltransferase [Halomonas sp. ML-15]|uniref:DNA cytosine methyltransferase n=1 Tax=Halomonas sp. ML-15 TaxID=2773305 RepID=UPI001747BCE5|nr:DNA cytosine methyltransferase [Halomonas sp. ML-15]MBD3897920.1 DNA cytosine methyltransferase [Halomonas sp. ML-15]
MTKPIHVVDLFAGPGGLGEGFSSIRKSDGSRQFQTLVSVEKDPAAHRTLTLRAFYRLLHDSGMGMSAYYDYLQGGEHPSCRSDVQHLWKQAQEEALCLKLGSGDGNRILEDRLRKELAGCNNWVLIGGPPCQAYSVVGRVRNRGNKNYRPEEDDRHFLYREYLNIIARFRPAVFVMENVRGMLTSRVGKDRIFGQILEDLRDPTKATGHKGPRSVMSKKDGYTIFSVEDERVYYPRSIGLFDSPAPLEEEEYNSFVIKAEQHGIPQARHRVILVGVRNDIVTHLGASVIATSIQMPRSGDDVEMTAAQVLDELPALRSGLSRHDSKDAWYATIRRVAYKVAKELQRHHSEHIKQDDRERIAEELLEIAKAPHEELDRRHDSKAKLRPVGPTTELEKWYHGAQNPNVQGLWYNHEARSHMETDLARYLYCATFAKVMKRSPIGTKEIYLDSLAPDHANWKSGKFADRFKVVLEGQPSKTITSHISKDGHYFIHFDPYQCRSLTVREAARLQTFPDDYYFEGNRTEQYVQVGNAVPPLLAQRIAAKVKQVMDRVELNEEKQAQAIQA